ncbi:hypothetical protein QVD17_40295 [Tagetes erecta]|uniref:Uncharacterized protein n=1 Tax=Tagetes erecta TaxID=13708 RepID=A0AAD8NHS2_TARER|nr:hypothetical protein QVD17_40295 [Tagetes erecta]
MILRREAVFGWGAEPKPHLNEALSDSELWTLLNHSEGERRVQIRLKKTRRWTDSTEEEERSRLVDVGDQLGNV